MPPVLAILPPPGPLLPLGPHHAGFAHLLPASTREWTQLFTLGSPNRYLLPELLAKAIFLVGRGSETYRNNTGGQTHGGKKALSGQKRVNALQMVPSERGEEMLQAE